MAALGQVAYVRTLVRRHGSSLVINAYLYGASGQVSVAIATRAQTSAQVVTPAATPLAGSGRPWHVGLPDHIGQSRMPLSFNIADAVPMSTVPFPTSLP